MKLRLAVSALLMTMALVSPAAAQTSASIAVTYDAANGHRGVLRLHDALADRELENAIRSGLPLRVRMRVELWKDGFLDDQINAEEWNVVLTFDPLSELYVVRSRSFTGGARVFTDYQSARAAVEGSHTVNIHPEAPGRYYFTAAVVIETLSLSDLEELERWLKGELQPAVSGDRSIPGAIGQGARRLFMRVLSLPERRYESRSDRFRI